MGVAPSLRVVVSGADLDAWARLKSAIVPNEPVTAEQIRCDATRRAGILLLAEVDGDLAGCGIAARSHFAGRGFVAPRVLPDFRRRGVGTALLLALADHVRSLGREELISFVYADEPESVAFAERFQQEVVDYQLEQIRHDRRARSPARRRRASRSSPWRAAGRSSCGPPGRSHSRGTPTCRCRGMSRSTSTNGCATRRPARMARSSRSSTARSSATRACWSTRTAPPWPSTG